MTILFCWLIWALILFLVDFDFVLALVLGFFDLFHRFWTDIRIIEQNLNKIGINWNWFWNLLRFYYIKKLIWNWISVAAITVAHWSMIPAFILVTRTNRAFYWKKISAQKCSVSAFIVLLSDADTAEGRNPSEMRHGMDSRRHRDSRTRIRSYIHFLLASFYFFQPGKS